MGYNGRKIVLVAKKQRLNARRSRLQKRNSPLYEITRILLLTAHLLCVNVASGAPLLCIWLEWRRSRTSGEAIRYLASGSVLGLLIGGAIGLLLGLLEWDASYQNVWTVQLGRRVFFGVLELLFSAALLAIYWFWRKRDEAPAWLSAARTLLPLVAATNLMYHFPLLFFSGQRLLDQPTDSAPLTGAEIRSLMFSGEIPALTVHFIVASVAVAGLMLAHLALRWGRLGREEDARWAAVAGGRWALGATLLQLPVGLWTLVALPRPMQNELVGSNPVGLVLFASSMVAALWLTRELVNLALGEADRKTIMRSATAMLLTITLMTSAHEIARGKRQQVNHSNRGSQTASPTTP